MKNIAFLLALLIQSKSHAQSLIIDTSYSYTGLSFLDPTTLAGRAFSCVKQNDGKIIVTGENGTFSYLKRFKVNGDIDSTFGFLGTVANTDMTFVSTSENIIIQPDGKILVLGRAYMNTTSRFCVARYTSYGALDGTFGVNGTCVIDIDPSFQEYAGAFCLLSDGKIIIAGASSIVSLTSEKDMQIVRLKNNGSIDSSFGANGVLYVDINDEDNWAESIAMFPDGKIAILGITYNMENDPSYFDCAIIKMNSDGLLDSSFDGDGKTIIDIPITTTMPFNSRVLSDGKLLIMHTIIGNSEGFLGVIKVNFDGSLDLNFGINGIATDDFAVGYSVSYANAMDLTSNDKIIIAGSGLSPTAVTPLSSAFFGQFNPSGQMDITFDEDGCQNLIYDPRLLEVTDIISISVDTFIIVGTANSSGGFISRLILDNTTGIQDGQTFENSIRVFPNPTTEYVQVQSEGNNITSLKIVDISGKILVHQKVTQKEISLNVQHLNDGLYFLQCETDHGCFEAKFFKE
jgi:uncharacterized delta-60 repeat protein